MTAATLVTTTMAIVMGWERFVTIPTGASRHLSAWGSPVATLRQIARRTLARRPSNIGNIGGHYIHFSSLFGFRPVFFGSRSLPVRLPMRVRNGLSPNDRPVFPLKGLKPILGWSSQDPALGCSCQNGVRKVQFVRVHTLLRPGATTLAIDRLTPLEPRLLSAAPGPLAIWLGMASAVSAARSVGNARKGSPDARVGARAVRSAAPGEQ